MTLQRLGYTIRVTEMPHMPVGMLYIITVMFIFHTCTYEEKAEDEFEVDTPSIINEDVTISTSVLRKETHRDQHLNINSNHPLEQMQHVMRTLTHRARSIATDGREKEGDRAC